MDILQLIPKGNMWNGKNVKNLFFAFQDFFMRLRQEGEKILIECFPDKSNALLTDWMRVCQVKNREGVLSTLAASGGNTDEYFLNIARHYDPKCQIPHPSTEKQFISGRSSAGSTLGEISEQNFVLVFIFSVEEKIIELENLFAKIKPAHVNFVYIYQKNKEILSASN